MMMMMQKKKMAFITVAYHIIEFHDVKSEFRLAMDTFFCKK